jgi:glycosyltransferase involved in cell wall biosynthesis
VDDKTYGPRPVERRRDTVVFYAREYTPRRAVPLGALALEELHARRPGTRFVAFGMPEDPQLPVPYEQLGIVSPERLSWVYSGATAGLCLSLTNYSLIPQEMLACGLPCVDLEGASASSVFGAEGPLELVPPDADALAAAIVRGATESAMAAASDASCHLRGASLRTRDGSVTELNVPKTINRTPSRRPSSALTRAAMALLCAPTTPRGS